MPNACRIKPAAEGNFLLTVLVLLFVFLHVMLCMHLEGRLRTPTTDYIELNLKTAFQPSQRQIPRLQPGQRPAIKPMPVASVPDKLPAAPTPVRTKPPVPMARPLLPEPEVPDTAALAAPAIVPLPARRPAPPPPINNPQDYFDLIRSRIDAFKIYPETARKRRQEGSVIVRFIVAKNGRVSSVEAIGGSSVKTLQAAAADAVMRASPFPHIPGSLGKERISIKLTIHFKLEQS